MQPVVTLRRRDKTLPGAPELAWSVLRPEPGVMAEGRVQFTKTHNPEHVWRDELTVHPNGADGLSDILLASTTGAKLAERVRTLRRARTAARSGVQLVACGSRPAGDCRPPGGQAMLPAFASAVMPFIAGAGAAHEGHRDHARGVIRNAVTPLFADDELICVGPADALGGYLLFHTVGDGSALAGVGEADARLRPLPLVRAGIDHHPKIPAVLRLLHRRGEAAVLGDPVLHRRR